MAKATAHKKKATVFYSQGHRDSKTWVEVKCQPQFTKAKRIGRVTPQV